MVAAEISPSLGSFLTEPASAGAGEKHRPAASTAASTAAVPDFRKPLIRPADINTSVASASAMNSASAVSHSHGPKNTETSLP